MSLRNLQLAVLVGFAASNAAAISLGNAQGSVVLGRPLDLVFEVRTDGAPIADACVTAGVSAGDTPLSSSQVRLTPSPEATGRAASVRVQTTQPIYEPVVQVRLAAGCSGTVVRSYTLLAYPVEALAAQQGAVSSPTALSAKSSDSGVSQVLNSQGTTASARQRQAARAEQQPPASRSKQTRPTPSVVLKPQLVAETGRPRLVMEPLSEWLDAPSVLRASTDMALSAPGTQAQRDEAAAYWRALNMQPQELLQEAARMVAQEEELAKQRAQAERDKAAALQVQQDLQQKVSERFSAMVVYGLGALALLLAAALLWMWTQFRRRTPQQERAWTQSVARPGETPVKTAAVASASAGGALEIVHTQAPGPAEHSLRLQPTEPEVLPSGIMPLEFGLPQPAPADASATLAVEPVSSVVNPEELFDLQQQAEFFVSVGEHDQAINVMRQHIDANKATSPLAYLDLLRLYRSLSRIEQFNALRQKFHRYFNAQVPEFAAFSRKGKTLFSYPDVLARIESLWCDPSVVPLLQGLLFLDQSQESQRFDLPAYDELLLLHAIARTTPASARGVTSPRARTTPLEAEAFEAPTAELPDAVNAVGTGSEHNGNLMGSVADWAFEVPSHAPLVPEAGVPSADLDLDLSEMALLDLDLEQADVSVPLPLLSQDAQPPVEPSAPPAGHQPIGFGSHSDRFEARVDPGLHKLG